MTNPHVSRIVIPIHIIGIISLGLFLSQWVWWYLPIIWGLWFLIGGVGVEIGLHRYFSHNAFELKSSVLKGVINWFACMGGQWSPVWWTALHRGYHHPYTDTEKDIHSPVRGKWNAFMGWMFTIKPTDVNLIYAKKLLIDPVQRKIHDNYTLIFWGSLLLIAAFYPPLFGLMTIAILLAMHQENIVNLFCHLPCFGYRNFDTPDGSRNITLLGLLFWGQGYHNNHHAIPKQYDFGVKPYEIDVCRWVVPALVWLDRKLSD